MKNHNSSTKKILLKTLGDDISITVTPAKDTGLENIDLAAITPCQIQLY